MDSAVDAALDFAIAAASPSSSGERSLPGVKIPQTIQTQLEEFLNVADAPAVLGFLQGADGERMRELAAIVKKGLAEAVKDDRLDVADVPGLIDTVRLSISKVAQMEHGETIGLQAAKVVAIPLVRFLIASAVKIACPGPVSFIIVSIVNSAIDATAVLFAPHGEN